MCDVRHVSGEQSGADSAETPDPLLGEQSGADSAETSDPILDEQSGADSAETSDPTNEGVAPRCLSHNERGRAHRRTLHSAVA